jgi:hypothetical protein
MGAIVPWDGGAAVHSVMNAIAIKKYSYKGMMVRRKGRF